MFMSTDGASAKSTLQVLYSRAKATHDLSYPLDLVKLRLKLIDLLQDSPETGDFGISRLNCIARPVVLCLCRNLRRTIELHATCQCVCLCDRKRGPVTRARAAATSPARVVAQSLALPGRSAWTATAGSLGRAAAGLDCWPVSPRGFVPARARVAGVAVVSRHPEARGQVGCPRLRSAPQPAGASGGASKGERSKASITGDQRQTRRQLAIAHVGR